MDYRFFRKAAFLLNAEVSHELTINTFKAVPGAVQALFGKANLPSAPVTAMGLQFPNPVGLAAGLDKNAECTEALGGIGFGFLEVGTVTPLAQSGNPKPRLFRLIEDEALINRMGFNNHGLDQFCRNLEASRFRQAGGIIGANIGKNKETPQENAAEDYVKGLQAIYNLASYATVNISSPNTPGLRALQGAEQLKCLLSRISEARKALQDQHGHSLPLALKIAPDDVDDEQLRPMLDAAVAAGMEGLITTNTTLDRSNLRSPQKNESGGLSGAPLRTRANDVLARSVQHLSGALDVIGVGGISSPEQALEKLQLGAKLVQIYSGFIYHGPPLVHESVTLLSKHLSESSSAP